MKIVFLCGSLEPGRDGVGDYTRRLAGELVRNDHQVHILSLNDRFIKEPLQQEQESDRIYIPTLRLPDRLALKIKLGLAKDRIADFDPEWISLQYVPFSFHEKGLPFKFAEQLKTMTSGQKWHIMFHELWVGMNREASLKFKIWGALQKKIINRTIHLLKPYSISTQSRLHQCYLKEMGHQVNLLPLFSNFKAGKEQNRNMNGSLKFLVFGSIHPGAPIEQFADELFQYGNQNNKRIHFIFLGRQRRGIELWIKICKDRNFETEILGEQEPEVVPEVIKKANIGVSSTPFYLYEKSGTIAAMMEHKLPVICVATEYTPTLQVPDFSGGVNNYQPDHLDIDSLKVPPFTNTVERTCRTFIQNLRFASSLNRFHLKPS